MIPVLICTISMHLYHYEPIITFLSYLPFYYKNPIFYIFPFICKFPTDKNYISNIPIYHSNMSSLIFLNENFSFFLKKHILYSYNFSNFPVENINSLIDLIIFISPLIINVSEYNIIFCNLIYVTSLCVIYFYYINEYYLFQWYFGSKMMILMGEMIFLNFYFTFNT